MDIIVAIIVSFITVAILNSLKIDKTSNQLMLLGIEITIVGAVLILMALFSNSNLVLFLMVVALTVIGFIVNLFGFAKK